MPNSELEKYLLKMIVAKDRTDLHIERNQQTVQLLELKKLVNTNHRYDVINLNA